MSPSSLPASRSSQRSRRSSSSSSGDGVGRTSRRQRRADRRADGRRSFLWRWRRGFFALGVLFVLAIAGAGYLFTQVSLPPSEPPLLQTSFMCASEVTTGCNSDNSLAQFSGGVDRVNVTYEQLPPEIINAVLATEDRDFFKHGGVDPVGIARAFVANIRNEEITQGGSTITQQYVKQTFLTNEQSFSRKAKEAALAVKIERELSKQEILTRYLNLIYMGRGAYGVQAASQAYFNKDVGDLTLAEAAYLAGVIRGPELADANLPETNPKKAAQFAEAQLQRSKSLGSMLDAGFIDQGSYDAAMADDWSSVVERNDRTGNFGRVERADIGTEYFVDYVKNWLVSSGNFTDGEIFGGGLRIYTTLDLTHQEQAYEAVTSTLTQPDDPAGSLVSIDGAGHVVAMMGGTDYATSEVNLAAGTAGGGSGRQPGSSFKPIVLAEALSQGIPLSTVFDAPAKKTFENINGTTEDWVVANYADAGLGQLNLVEATKKSSNTAYAQLMLDVGPDNVVALAERMGVATPLEPNPSLVLGTSGVSVLDMASAYSTLANSGEHIAATTVTRVTDAKGTVLYEAPGTRERIIPEDIAKEVNWTLNQVIDSGTGTSAQFGQPAAGKTGTTEGYRDAWFVGYTCELTAAVWMGYPGADAEGPQFMTDVHGIKVTGGSFPAEIWRKYMAKATEGLESCPFDKPTLAPASTGTSLPDWDSSSSSTTTTTTDSSSTSTTERTGPTTTTSPPTTPPTSAPTTTTTEPPETTTTTEPP